MDIPNENNATITDSAFIAGINGAKPHRTPVWMMRQAGRSLPEYRAKRGIGSILDALKDPSLACEITLQPVARYDVDAAILYSDIIVPVHAAGFGVEIIPGKGPVTEKPFTRTADLARLDNFDASRDTAYVMDTIKLLKKELKVPLIGFAGGPFTVASYLIEGEPTRTFTKTRQFMNENPDIFDQLLERLTEITIDFLCNQISSGIDAVQIFDSWVGALNRTEYERFISSHMKRIFANETINSVPTILFGVNTEPLLDLFAQSGPTALGIDANTSIAATTVRLGSTIALQGNLDPTLCLTDSKTAVSGAHRVLVDSRNTPGYIFNLGHGVLPETDPEILGEVVSYVHEHGRAIRDSAYETDEYRSAHA